MKERVLAIIVSYNPDCGLLRAVLDGLEKQGCTSLVVDNGSQNLALVQAAVVSLESTVLRSQDHNLGLGAAHNIGIEYAVEHDFDYVLIMDQDSVPLAGMVTNLLRAHKLKSRKCKVSAVGVTYLNSQNNSESFFVRFGTLKFARHYCSEQDSDGCIEADFLISSGSLIALQTISSVGSMDEDLFIDHVDTEWFLRARSQNHKAFGVCSALMKHGLGENTHRISLGGRQRNVPQHKPFRYYYIFRNSIVLYKRGYASTLWKWNDIQRLLMIMVMFGLVKSPRLENLSMMLKGLWHGVLSRHGPLDNKSIGLNSKVNND